MYNWDSADYDNIGLYLSDVDWYNLVTIYPSAPALWNVLMSIIMLLSCMYPNAESPNPIALENHIQRAIGRCVNVVPENDDCGGKSEQIKMTR